MPAEESHFFVMRKHAIFAPERYADGTRSPACGIGLKRVEDPAVLGNVVGSRAPPI